MRNSDGTNCLAIEYETMYRDSRGNLRFANRLDNADGQSPSCVFGPGFFEKLQDIPCLKGGLGWSAPASLLT